MSAYPRCVCTKEGLEHLKRRDKICPKCGTADHTLLSSSEQFGVEFLAKDFQFSPEGEGYIPVKQETYVCSRCSTFWKGLAYSDKIESMFTKYVVLPQTSKIRLDFFHVIWECMVWTLVLIGVVGFLALMCTLQ